MYTQSNPSFRKKKRNLKMNERIIVCNVQRKKMSMQKYPYSQHRGWGRWSAQGETESETDRVRDRQTDRQT